MRLAAEALCDAQAGRKVRLPRTAKLIRDEMGPEVPHAGFSGSWNKAPSWHAALYRAGDEFDRTTAREWLLASATGQTTGTFGLCGKESPFSPTYFGGNIAGFADARAVAIERGDHELAAACTLLLEQARTLLAPMTLVNPGPRRYAPCELPPPQYKRGKNPPDKPIARPGTQGSGVVTWAPGTRAYSLPAAYVSDLTSAMAALLLGLPHTVPAGGERTLTYWATQHALAEHPLPGLLRYSPGDWRWWLGRMQGLGVKVRAPLHYLLTDQGYSAWISKNTTGNGAPCYGITVTPDEVHVLCLTYGQEGKGGHRAGLCIDGDNRILATGGWGKVERTSSIPLSPGPPIGGWVVDMRGARELELPGKGEPVGARV